MTLLSSQAHANECVILLHGLARTDSSMKTLSKALNKTGYQTINVSYPSTKYPIEQLAEESISKALADCPQATKINFVTHSMGGILLRHYLSKNTIENMGRAVMLAPPNKGSEIVDKLGAVPGFEFINGPAGMQLGTNHESIPSSLGAVNFELGIIAGTRSINPILSSIIPKPNDGKVSVENSKVAGMSDHLELAVTHTFMMNRIDVIKQVIYFLQNGVFYD